MITTSFVHICCSLILHKHPLLLLLLYLTRSFGQIIPQISQLNISQPIIPQQQPMSGSSIGPLLTPSAIFSHNITPSSSQVLSSVAAPGGYFTSGFNFFPSSQIGTNTIVAQTIQTIPMAIGIHPHLFLGDKSQLGGNRQFVPIGPSIPTTTGLYTSQPYPGVENTPWGLPNQMGVHFQWNFPTQSMNPMMPTPQPYQQQYMEGSSQLVYGPTSVPIPCQYYQYPQANRQLSFLDTLDLVDLSRLTNDLILHAPFWPPIPAKLPFNIPKSKILSHPFLLKTLFLRGT
jgi:hypothetical protein